jgi:hypothetical protein
MTHGSAIGAHPTSQAISVCDGIEPISDNIVVVTTGKRPVWVVVSLDNQGYVVLLDRSASAHRRDD